MHDGSPAEGAVSSWLSVVAPVSHESREMDRRRMRAGSDGELIGGGLGPSRGDKMAVGVVLVSHGVIGIVVWLALEVSEWF